MKKQNPLFACSFMGWLAQSGVRAWKWDQVVIVKRDSQSHGIRAI